MTRLDVSRWFAGIAGSNPYPTADEPSPESDARVRRAIDTLPVTMFEFDRDGIYTSVAGGYIGLFGITPSVMIGRSVFQFPKFVPGKNLMVRRALAGEAVSFTGIWPRGRFMIKLNPRFDANGRVTAVVGLGFEIAKPAARDKYFEQLIEALRQSEARFRAMCDCAPLGICVSSPTFELGYVNPALCELLGCSPDELLGRQWESVLHAHTRDRVLAVRDSNPRSPGGLDGILHLVRKDGSSVWVSLRVAEMRDEEELIGYVGTLADVTQERVARLAIDRAQHDLRRVIESNPEGIAVVRDDRWIFVNRALAEALGYSRDTDLIGRDANELLHPDDRARALELRELHQHDRGALELRYRRANDEYALMEVRAALLAEFEGAPALLLTARDITERKRLQAQLQVTERLLVVGTLAAGVAHEINNPLGAVSSNLEWIEQQLARAAHGGEAELRDTLSRLARPIAEAREAADRMRAIMCDLKLFSRAEEELLAPVDLTLVLDSAVRMAWNELRHRARLLRDYADLPAVRGNEARLGQVFLNLLINAAQAIPEGRASEHEIAVSARAGADAQSVVVEVRDTGCGIAADVIGRIFDPFFTTKPPGIGTGLGLSICQRIVSSYGGQIEVISEPGRGSTFRVTLATSASSEPSARKDGDYVLSDGSGPRGRVLVIDDDVAMGNAIELVLTEDHDVEVFTSARRALEKIRDGHDYDAIICDVMMPDMSGMDFHAALAASHPALTRRIIFLTGGAFTVSAREFLDRVHNPRLDKPFGSQSLRALVRQQVAWERSDFSANHFTDSASSTRG